MVIDSTPIAQDTPVKDTADGAHSPSVSRADTDSELKSIITDVLGIDASAADEFSEATGLFGHLPELDSMAVAGLLTEIEDRLGIVIEDDDVDGEMLETYGGLLTFVETKIAQSKTTEG